MPQAPHEALWWDKLDDGRILCRLCPRNCRIHEGKNGFCFVRKNEGGRLVSLAYGRPAALNVDPVEKKPLNHFLPGTAILSLGTAGCNLGCRFCQNWDLSKARADQRRTAEVSPDNVVRMARREGAPSIAFTYNDPTVFGEYVIDVSKAAHEQGLKTVMVTAGYIHAEPCRQIYRHIDGANVDLKSFSEKFYRRWSLAHLQPVLDTLVLLRNETDVWIEITNLIVPGENDDPAETRRMADWIVENLGRDMPVHFSAFHPAFKMTDRPRTPNSTLEQARRIAQDSGLRYVYLGNVRSPEGQTTFCPTCGAVLIERDWHTVISDNLRHNRCAHCNETIAGVFPQL